MWRAGSDSVDWPPRGRDRASARSYPTPDSCTSRADRHNGDRSGTQVDKSCARGRIMASGFSWAPPWPASGPRWLSLRVDSSPMITLFPSQGDFCVTAIRDHASIENALPVVRGIKAAIEVEVGTSQVQPDLLGHLLQGLQTLGNEH